MKKIKVKKEIIDYLKKLNYEYQGYMTLIKEFTILNNFNCSYELNEDEYNTLITKANISLQKINIALEEITGSNIINNYNINFEEFIIEWN
jgi:cell fate regulator YaaT (PSP1 superfamily)